jgi:hypothetical protein
MLGVNLDALGSRRSKTRRFVFIELQVPKCGEPADAVRRPFIFGCMTTAREGQVPQGRDGSLVVTQAIIHGRTGGRSCADLGPGHLGSRKVSSTDSLGADAERHGLRSRLLALGGRLYDIPDIKPMHSPAATLVVASAGGCCITGSWQDARDNANGTTDWVQGRRSYSSRKK